MTQFKGLTSFATLTSVCHLPTSKIIGVDCHSAPCFKVDLFQSNLYSVLEFYHLLHFKLQKLVEKYNICIRPIAFVITYRIISCYMPIGEPMKKLFTGF